METGHLHFVTHLLFTFEKSDRLLLNFHIFLQKLKIYTNTSKLHFRKNQQKPLVDSIVYKKKYKC